MINNVSELQKLSNPFTKEVTSSDSAITSFSEIFSDKLNEVNQLQQIAAEEQVKVVAGDSESIHQSMIANQKALLSLQLTVEIRNKLLEAYQEIMRMQM